MMGENDVKAIMMREKRRHGTPGRRWVVPRSNKAWFNRYVTKPYFRMSPAWKASSRVPMHLLHELLASLRKTLRDEDTTFRKAIPTNIRLAAFLMYADGATFDTTESYLGIRKSTGLGIVDEVSMCIINTYS